MGEAVQAEAVRRQHVEACMRQLGYVPVEADSAEASAFERGEGTNSGVSAPTTSTSIATTDEVLLFGGEEKDVYLGCLSCSEYASESVINEYGPYGNEFATESIWNSYSRFGSSTSRFSPCNPYALDPPIIVDEAGNYYGRLTLNLGHPDANPNATLRQFLAQLVCTG